MSWYYPKRGAKAPADGIKLTKVSERGQTWWGKRWVDSVARIGSEKRLERGLRYARAGRVLSLQVEKGFVALEVQGSAVRPYKVEIALPMFTRNQSTRVVDAILKKAFYTAKLLAGEMPREIETLFQGAGAPLIPTSQTDLSADCTCPDLEDPCKHIMAAYFVLGQEIDQNPFLLMEMRGLGRAQLLAEIQSRRSSGGVLLTKNSDKTRVLDGPGQTLLKDNLNDFFSKPKDNDVTPPLVPEPKSDLLKPGDRIREMGTPPFWHSDNNFEDVLIRIYEAVRKRVVG